MVLELAARTYLIKPSPTLSLDAEVKALKAIGKKIVNLGVGEPDFETPEFIREAAIKAIRDGFTRYTPSEGILALREAVAHKFKIDNNLDYSPADIVITNGGKHALYNVMQALFSQGDEVIIPIPYWVTYPEQVTLAGATPVFVRTQRANNYILTPEELESALTPRTKGLILNSPANPTGMVYSRENLLGLAAILRKQNIWVISDDIYEKLIYDGFEFANLPMVAPDLKEQTVICHGVSKTYSMTGWRIGFLAGPRKVAQAITRMQSQMTSNPCSIAQIAGLAALTGPLDSYYQMLNTFNRRRQLILKLLNEIPGVSVPVPRGAFYAFADISLFLGTSISGVPINTSDDLAALILKKCEVALIPGTGFGQEGSLRFSYAVSEEEIKEGLERISHLFSSLVLKTSKSA
ncbi:MAG: pyridoxal phosphate-dependent aminotransferase [Deltaproteobacteria bacterium]|jgi:aspartate aminotransferase|nr:pyridoxal phosphate-dependent aminotransferase [Deltaproteobacteria bacterium]